MDRQPHRLVGWHTVAGGSACRDISRRVVAGVSARRTRPCPIRAIVVLGTGQTVVGATTITRRARGVASSEG